MHRGRHAQAKLVARIKAADHIAAYYEATRLAGFGEAEAVKYFGHPRGIDPAALDLEPWPAALAETRFLERFGAIAAAASPRT